ncbi:arylesterase [Zoogloea sp.]|jgi:acyl-CoA thioesterase-1|uniref:arylesterase n=1 Tax=Zoogloea sp. TaxID=49181 RepID=UPI0035B195D2
MLGALLRTALACLLLASGNAWAGTVLVWGDSLSAGYGLRPQQSWPALLAERISAARLPHKVVNASISGETTAGGLARLPAALETHKPSVVVIELGANDGLRGLPVKAMATNLQAMVDASRKAGAQVLLVGMRMPPNYGPEYTSRFEAAYRDIARANRLRLVPFMMEGFADQPGYFQADGLHPVAAAQPLILDTIWRELKPLLR